MLRVAVALPLPLPEIVVELWNPDDVFVDERTLEVVFDRVVLLEDEIVLLEDEDVLLEGLIELLEEEEVLLEDVVVPLLAEAQVPSPFGLPLKHLQLLEHGSPAAPLLLPSSHSSPRLDSQILLPQPAGVAPRLIIYGRPEWPSPNVCVPFATTPSAIARAWKPLTPTVGYVEKASWTLQLQLDR
jgi:hypothetical protein